MIRKLAAPLALLTATAERADFALPPRMRDGCTAAAASRRKAARATARRVTFRVVRRGSRYVVSGRAPSGRRLGITVKRARKVVVSRRATARRGRFRMTFRVRRPGRYTVTARSVRGTPRLAGTRTLRLKGS